ncbi:MAG: hypothetical protein ACRC8S_18785 [Fimbriiglobus sp.]
MSKPPPTNLLLQFVDNKFDAWSISNRVNMPFGVVQVEVAPMPRRAGW